MAPTMPDTDREAVHGVDFERDAKETVLRLQRACANLLAALPEPIHRAVDLERSLRLDKKLAWQVFKIAGTPSHTFSEGLHAPARASIRRLVSAIRRKKPPQEQEIVSELLDAFDAFEAFVTVHAGDRETLRSMVASIGNHAGHEVVQKHREAMYRACSHVWGLKADAGVRCEIFHPSQAVDGAMDIATVTGLVNLHRLRHGPPVSVTVGAGGVGDARQSEGGGQFTLASEDRPTLLEEFSDETGGPIAWVPHPHLPGHAELHLNDLGRAAAASLFTRQVTRARADRPHPEFENGASIVTPMELIVCDLVVPEGYSDPTTANVTVRGSRVEFPVWEVRPSDMIPHHEHVATFMSQTGVPSTPEVPRYQEAVSHVLRTMGWDSTRFDVYRCRMAYPIFHTIIKVDVKPVTSSETPA